MHLPSYFKTFLKNIRLTDAQKKELRNAHTKLRERLKADDNLKKYFVSAFLQGSYRRHTALRSKGCKRSDVDIIVVTNLEEGKYTPQEALSIFEPFMDKHYKGKWQFQGRSIGIEMSKVDLDLVITSAPSEQGKAVLSWEAVTTSSDDIDDWRLVSGWIAPEHRMFLPEAQILLANNQAEWKSEPLRIPDRDANCWQDTDPLTQLQWTVNKNKNCNGHFVNVVKALKWWRLEKSPGLERPKGFTLERLVAEACPNKIDSVAEGITKTLEYIVVSMHPDEYSSGKPVLEDYGLPDNDVWARITADDYKNCHEQITDAAELARQALDSNDSTESANIWRKLFGNKFPLPAKSSNSKGFSPPSGSASPNSETYG